MPSCLRAKKRYIQGFIFLAQSTKSDQSDGLEVHPTTIDSKQAFSNGLHLQPETVYVVGGLITFRTDKDKNVTRKAIYAGTFDPITLGHLDLVERAAKTFDQLTVSVASSEGKAPLFPVEERVELVRQVISPFNNVHVVSFSNLLVDHAREQNVDIIVRGLRAFSDFEFEFQMALTNRRLAPEIETIFLMPKEEYSYISSKSVREIAAMGGNVGLFTPPVVQDALKKKLQTNA